MRLPPAETERFYRIWFALLHDVNNHLHLVPSFPVAPGMESVSPEVTVQVRDALWAHDELRERFISENPAHLPPNDLALVASWRHRLDDLFIIFRSLSNYTIFLSQTAPEHAYGVLGLVSTIEETVPLPLPVYTRAVLLPWGRQIIYDSLLNAYNVVIGPGIRGELQDLYRNLQEREGIITSLLPQDQETSPAKVRSGITARNRKVLTAFRRELAKSGLSSQTLERHVGQLSDFAQTALLEQDPPRGLLDLTSGDLEHYLRGHADPAVLTSFKRFARFLINTGRIDYEVGEALADRLKELHVGE